MLYLITFLVLGLLCETVLARGPGNGPPRRYKIVGGVIQISEPEHLIDLMDPANAAEAWGPNAEIRLMCNINMAGIPLIPNVPDTSRLLGSTGTAVIGGTQIGNTTTPFRGTFDGDGYVIQNLAILGDGNQNAVPDDADGLFGVVGVVGAPALAAPGHVISNVILRNPWIVGSATDIGCLVGRLNNGTIYQCCVLGPGGVLASGGGVNFGVGGLVGQINEVGPSFAVVDECFAQGFNVIGPDDVGGLVGRMNGGLVENSYAIGHFVIGALGGLQTPDLGGFVGFNNFGVITACYADCAAPVLPAPVQANVGAFAGSWNWVNALVVANFCDVADGPATNLLTPAIGAPDLNVPLGPSPTAAANAVPAASLTVASTYTTAWWGVGSAWVLPSGLTPRLAWRPF
jgi:hypothetical protein